MKEIAIFAEKLVTPFGNAPLRGRNLKELKVMENVYIVFNEKIIDITKSPPGVNVQAQVKLITPGFVDCHTHIPFYGFRSKEFVMRAQGAKYVEILKAGGGIHFTSKMVGKASVEDLVKFNKSFLDEMLLRGVTWVEGKSGYGLDEENEIKQLSALKKLSEIHPIDLTSTFLGAHVIPKGKSEKEYLEELVNMFDKIKNLARFVDIFVDAGVFSVEGARWYLREAKRNGFEVRLHADEIERTGAAVLGVEVGAKSVDHLIKISEKDVEILANSDVACVMMPATSFFLGEDYAPARKLIDAGAIVALASDFNPGSNTINDPTFVIHLAVSKLKMLPEEALAAFTLNSAYVLGISDIVGSVEVGKQADFVAWRVDDINGIPYLPGHNIVEFVVKRGQIFEK